ncbi:hypothetical protein HYX58_04675 [Candidatus Dependentiae bacterium]|nr:hypothetical protein [Candidatus Dependentiae bacterium]
MIKAFKLPAVLIIAFFLPFQNTFMPRLNAVDSKTVGLFSVGAATGLLISLFHRHWVLDKVAQINQMHGSGELCDSTLWSPLSFNGIDDSVIGQPLAASLEQTSPGEQFEYKLISSRIHLPTFTLTQHTITNDYLVNKEKNGKKFAIKNHTSFHEVKLGSSYPYFAATALLTLGTGYAFTLLNKK